MEGIRKREIVGLTLVVALFGAVASPAFALTADLGQTSVSTDTAANLVQGGSARPTRLAAAMRSDTGKAVTDTSGASPQTNVDATPATGSGAGQPARSGSRARRLGAVRSRLPREPPARR